MQTHFRTHMFERLHLEVSRPQPGFDGAEGMLDGAAANAHTVRHAVHAVFHLFQDGLMLPPTDPPFLTRCALRFQSAFGAS